MFPRVLSSGKRHNSQSLLLTVVESDSNAPSRFTFSISKKVSKNATDRNTARRRGYSSVSRHLDSVKPGYLLFFSFKKGSGRAAFSTIEKEIVDLLHASGVLK